MHTHLSNPQKPTQDPHHLCLLIGLLGRCLEKGEHDDAHGDHGDTHVRLNRVLLAPPQDRNCHDRNHLAGLDDHLRLGIGV